MRSIKSFMTGIAAAAFLTASLTAPAQAAMIGTQQAVQSAQSETRATRIAEVNSYLARAEVGAELQRLGVAPELVKDRVASLTDQELEQLAMNINEQPAGGDALVILGVIFLVLIVLEVVGVTNVFSRF